MNDGPSYTLITTTAITTITAIITTTTAPSRALRHGPSFVTLSFLSLSLSHHHRHPPNVRDAERLELGEVHRWLQRALQGPISLRRASWILFSPRGQCHWAMVGIGLVCVKIESQRAAGGSYAQPRRSAQGLWVGRTAGARQTGACGLQCMWLMCAGVPIHVQARVHACTRRPARTCTCTGGQRARVCSTHS